MFILGFLGEKLNHVIFTRLFWSQLYTTKRVLEKTIQIVVRCGKVWAIWWMFQYFQAKLSQFFPPSHLRWSGLMIEDNAFPIVQFSLLYSIGSNNFQRLDTLSTAKVIESNAIYWEKRHELFTWPIFTYFISFIQKFHKCSFKNFKLSKFIT